jgi:hypothetical protein
MFLTYHTPFDKKIIISGTSLIALSDFFWEAQILAACCGSTAVLTEILGILDKALVLFLRHRVTKLAEMSVVPLMRYLECCL